MPTHSAARKRRAAEGVFLKIVVVVMCEVVCAAQAVLGAGVLGLNEQKVETAHSQQRGLRATQT